MSLFQKSLALFFCSSLLTLAAAQHTPSVLIYSYTDGFRHDSIPTAIQSLKQKASAYNVQFDSTEDKAWFNDTTLAKYDALLFLSTTGEVLDANGKAAFQRYLNQGGGFIGVHAASAGLVNTTFYIEELGASFDYHPELQNATIDVIDKSHPSTSMLPDEWHVQDEMYNFISDPRSLGAVVVLSANESSYKDPNGGNPKQGTPHPTAWYQEHGAGVQSNGTAGRSFYTSLGHSNATWQDDVFLAHVFGGITWTVHVTVNVNQSQPSGSGSGSSSSPTSKPSSPSSTSASIRSLGTTSIATISTILLGLFCASLYI
jgi:type 1 glutamine amidotransferase